MHIRETAAEPSTKKTRSQGSKPFASLRTKLLAFYLPGLVVALLATFALQEIRAYNKGIDDMAARVQRYVEQTSTVFAAPVWAHNERLTRQFMAVMAQDPDILALAVYDRAGNPIWVMGDEADLGGRPDLFAARQLFHVDDGLPYFVGSMVVTFSNARLIDEAWEAAERGLGITMLVVLAVSILTVVSTGAILQKPLDLLLASIRRTEEGGEPQAVDWTSDDELGAVVRAFNTMQVSRAVAEHETERLVDLGGLMAAERSTRRLLETILVAAKEVFNADGGTVYFMNEARNALEFGVILNDSMKIRLGGERGDAIPFPALALYDEDGNPNHANVATHVAITGDIVNIPDVYESDEFDFAGPRKFDAENGYRSTSFLVFPLKNRQGAVAGVLQLINAQDRAGDAVVPFDRRKEGYVLALATQAGVALENQMLIAAQKKLLDSFIQLIAGAIDAKSPYTGGHCNRVPELAEMLCRAASESDAPPFADFRFETEDEWREFHIGAWLHDCGKVTTPEYVVDKATKLETIFNRIHEIRTRFEVLWRDARIDYLERRSLEGADEAPLKVELDARLQSLHDDFAFVAECNVGGEFMDPEKIERLEAIAEETWTRHFDDRLGLSYAEMERYDSVPHVPVPAVEKLLADKAEHVIPREFPAFGETNPHGFKMAVPENLYDLGELHNLRIPRGTLTDEERFKINDHIIQTIVMLENLPFPKHLERVPEYAGAHHETMIGTGYPRKLRKEDVSVPGRIMAIADIFEALTASDRPYKKAKTLSEALRIMGFMRKDQHIDADIFELFLRSGVYKQYADRFLAPEQVDEVDIEDYIAR